MNNNALCFTIMKHTSIYSKIKLLSLSQVIGGIHLTTNLKFTNNN